MKKRFLTISLFCIYIFSITSCEKENIYNDTKDEINSYNNTTFYLKSGTTPWAEQILFNGTLDINNIWLSNYPWGNPPYIPNICENSRTCRIESNLVVQNNTLKIKTDKGPYDLYANDGNNYSYDWTSGRIYSRDTYKYGYFEITCKVPCGQGIGAAFWLWNSQDEIDVFEMKGWYPFNMPTNYHRRNYNANYPLELDKNNIPGSPNFTTSYNTIGLEWTASKLAWYVNDVPVRKTNIDIPTQELHIIVDVNCPTYSVCPNKLTIFPNYFDIKEIIYYSERPINSLFLSTSNNGDLSTIKDFTKWRKTWDIMVSGDFDNDNLTDVLLYDKTNGEAHFYNSSGMGKSFTGWRKTWDIIIPGNFDGTGNTDLLFYDSSNGQVYFYKVYSDAGLGYIKSFTGWRKTWDIMVPGDFDNDNLTDVLLYDKTNGEAHFYNSSGIGRSFTGWRKTWDIIVPGNFDGTGNTDLLFYDSSNGQAYFYKVNSDAGLGYIKSFTNWRKTWKIMIPGDFDNDNLTDVLLYDKNNGEAHFYNSTGIGKTYYDWRKSWNNIISGNFDNINNDDLLLYDNN